MSIRACTYNLTFAPNPNIRKSLFALEDALDGFQKPFTLIPVPEDAPLDFPRITASSPNGHSTLFVSGQNAQIQSVFDDAYKSEVGTCLSYSKNRALSFYDAFGSFASFDFFFSGLTVQVDFPNIGDADPAGFIRDTFINIKGDFQLDDAAIRLVFVLRDRFYFNIEIKRDLLFQEATSLQMNPWSPDLSKAQEVFTVVMDVNDRYAFNRDHSHRCSRDDIESIYSIVESYLSDGIDDLVVAGMVRI